MTSSNFSQHEVEGVTDFLQSQPSSELAVNLAHIISNNAIKCENVSGMILMISLLDSSFNNTRLYFVSQMLSMLFYFTHPAFRVFSIEK